MQYRLPLSKPLLLVLIGLIIGASLGLGSGYAIFYPSMVREHSRSLDDRVSEIEGNVTLIGDRLDEIDSDMDAFGDSLEGILALSEVIQQVSERVSTLESGQLATNSELDNVEDSLNSINQDLSDLIDAWETTQSSFDDLESVYSAANNELEAIQVMVRGNDGIRIFSSYMANPSAGFKDDITNEIYQFLIQDNEDFVDWVGIYSETTAKLLLRQEVDDLIGSLVWNPSENTEVGTDTYQVKLETYFNFEFTLADISVSKMHLEIKATINVDNGNITQKTVTLVELV